MTPEALKTLCEKAAKGELLKHVDSDFIIYNKEWLYKYAKQETDIILKTARQWKGIKA